MIVKGKVHVGGEQLFDANVDIDVFKSKNDKITANARIVRSELPKGYNITNNVNIQSKGQKLDVKLDQHFAATANSVDLGSTFFYTDQHLKPKSFGAFFSASPQQVDVFAYIPGKELIKSHTAVTVAKDTQKVENEFAILGHKPIVATIEFKDYNSFKFNYGSKGQFIYKNLFYFI